MIKGQRQLLMVVFLKQKTIEVHFEVHEICQLCMKTSACSVFFNNKHILRVGKAEDKV